MITYKISTQGKKLVPNESPIILGNKFDSNSTRLTFRIDEDIYDGYKYIALQYPDKEKIILVQLDSNNNFWVGTSVTSHVGTWQFCLIISTTTIPEDGNVLDSNVIYISDAIKAKVKDNFLDANFDVAENEPNLKIYYNNLNALTDELRSLNAKERIEVLETGLDESNNDISQLQTIVDETTELTTHTAQVAQIDNVIGDLPLDITARVIATQSGSGDPSPDNIRPIIGRDEINVWRGGRNLLNAEHNVVGGLTWLTGVNVASTDRVRNNDYIPVGVGQKLCRNKSSIFFLYDKDKIYLGNGSVGNKAASSFITAPYVVEPLVCFVRITYSSGYGTDLSIFADAYVGFFGIATAYEPYNGGTFDIALPKTMYGMESAPAVVDVTEGTIENPTRGTAFDGTENWYSSKTYDGNNRMVLTLSSGNEAKYVALDSVGDMKSSHYLVVSANKTYSGVRGIAIQEGKYIIIYDSSFNTVAAWKAHLAEQKAAGTPVQVAHQLAEPETISIDPVVIPSNDGTNIAYTNAGGETTVTGKVGIRASEEIIKKYPFSSRYEFFQHGRTITIEPATGSIIKVTPDSNTTITHGTDTYTLTANTPFGLIAKPGKNIITASDTLMVEYNRSSMSVLDQLTIPVSNTAQIAQIDGVIGDLPLDITARVIATQSGSGDPSPDNKRAIVGRDKVTVARCGANLLDTYKIVQRGTEADLVTPGSFVTKRTDQGIIKVKGWTLDFLSNQWVIDNLSPNTKYKISLKLKYIAAPNESYTILYQRHQRLYLYSPTKTSVFLLDKSVVMAVGDTLEYTGVFTTPADISTHKIVSYSERWLNDSGSADYATLEFSDIMISLISDIYEPYNGGTFDIALPKTVYGLESAPVLLDVNKGIIENPTLLKVFDGTEAIMANDTTYKAFYYRLQTMKYVNGVITPGIASHFVNASTVTNLLKTPSVVFGKYGNVIYIIFPEPTTVEKVKDLLAEQYAAGTPVQVLYQSLEPEIITINPTVIPSNDGRNTVYTDSGGETTVTGRQSPVAAIEEVKKAIVALGGAINV